MENDFIFGNEAVARGALESGVGFVSSYPGTPASEIADYFSKISKNYGIYFEYSTNEKVALEAATGAAFSNIKSMTIMKHYGLNVALDSLMPLIYLECPLVVVVADDPGCFSSVQTEEDTRHISNLAKIPTLVPSNPQEAKNMAIRAFELAWRYKIPILLRMTTRVSYSKSVVSFGEIPEIKNKGVWPKKEFLLGASQTLKLHQRTLQKIAQIKEGVSEAENLNKIENGSGKIGVVTAGVSYEYLKEILGAKNLTPPILKIGMSYPFPKNLAKKFISNLDKILVIEENDPIIENELRKINSEKIYGKDLISEVGELSPEDIEIALSKIFNFKISENLSSNISRFDSSKIPFRTPFWCPGCPHRETFKAIKEVFGQNAIYGGDIGCYMIGAYPPAKMLDYVVSMGASVGIAHGISKSNPPAGGKKVVAFIGDSTFFHAGTPALINAVFNKSNILIVVLDNRCTAMTGHQPHPGTGLTGEGEKTKELKIEEIAKSCGADNIEVINVYDQENAIEKIKKLAQKQGVSVLVAKGECVIYKKKRLKKERGE